MPPPLSIALLSREFPPFFGGGIGTATSALAMALAQGGHRVTVLTVGRGADEQCTKSRVPGAEEIGPNAEDQAPSGVRVVRLPFLASKAASPRPKGQETPSTTDAKEVVEDWSRLHPAIADDTTRSIFESALLWRGSAWAWHVANQLPRLCERFEFDVLEAPDTGALAWFALAMRRARINPASAGANFRWPPIVTCVHSPTAWIHELNRDPIRSRAMRSLVAMERDSIRWSMDAGGVCCPSNSLAKWTEPWAGLEPGGGGREGTIERIGYALGELEAVLRRTIHGSESARADGADQRLATHRVLFIGRLEYRKGIDTLLNAWSRVHRAMPGASLSLAGADTADPERAGPLGERLLRELATRGGGARRSVHALGRQHPEAIQQLLREHAVVVVPSPDDNLPYTMIEAMAHGRVVVASRAGGMAETIRDGVDALLFEPSDAADLARVLMRAMAMPPNEQRAMGKRAAARALELFGNERIAKERVAFYERAIERSRHRQALRAAGVGQRSSALAASSNEVRVIGACTPEAQAALRAALEANPEADFAHAWTRTPDGRVHAFITPTVESLADAPRHIGPIAVEGSAMTRLPQAQAGLHGWGLARALLAAACQGVVVPGAISPVSPQPEDASTPMPDPREAKPPLAARVRAKLGRAMAAVRGAEPEIARETTRSARGEAP